MLQLTKTFGQLNLKVFNPPPKNLLDFQVK